jgi:hypothetical protein
MSITPQPSDGPADLSHVRAISLLNSRELFGQEKGNIEWFKALRRQGASIAVGLSKVDGRNQLKEHLHAIGFEVLGVPQN